MGGGRFKIRQWGVQKEGKDQFQVRSYTLS